LRKEIERKFELGESCERYGPRDAPLVG
jgi:hypothetical protein